MSKVGKFMLKSSILLKHYCIHGMFMKKKFCYIVFFDPFRTCFFSEILMFRDFVHALSLRCKDLSTWPFFTCAGLQQSHALPTELVSLGIQNFTSITNCTLFFYLHWNSVGETIAKHSFASVLKKAFW